MDDSKVEGGHLGSFGSLESFRPLEKVLCLRIDDGFGDGDSEEVSPKVYFLLRAFLSRRYVPTKIELFCRSSSLKHISLEYFLRLLPKTPERKGKI